MAGAAVGVPCALAGSGLPLIGAPEAWAAGTSEVTTAAYGNLRDDWDQDEPALGPSAVQSGSFGELFSTKVSGAIYGQPLVYHGTVIVTTERAKAYGIDASTGAIEWERTFGTPLKASIIGCSDLKPYIGSTSTPVIDTANNTVYLTTRLVTGPNGLASTHYYLQAISASTGEERPGFPSLIAGTPVNTPGVPFNESHEEQRPGLLLLNGVIYMAFASDCDITPYRGIVVGMNAEGGAITTMWSDEAGVGTEENSQAGIWQSGGGLVSDEPNRIVLSTGNGVSPVPAASSHAPETLSESVLALSVGAGGALTPTQFFAPSDAPTLDQNDEDLGAGGPIALPTEYFGTKSIPHLLVQVGKDGRVFLINSDDMGGYRQGPEESDAVLQTLGPFAGVWGHPAAYGGQGGYVYVLESAGGGYLRAFSYGLSGEGKPALAAVATSTESFGYSAGSPLVTSDGTAAGSAVVWVVDCDGSDGRHAQLRAYAAAPEGETLPLLWSHSISVASKFAVPTAAEGRVYVGTRKNRLIAFGPTGGAALRAAPVDLGAVAVGARRTATLSISATQNVTVTGPVTVSGEQASSASTQRAGAGSAHAASGHAARASRGSHAGNRTAGPKTIPPSGNAPLAAGVISVQQPRIGTAIAAGTTLRLRIAFTPARRGPVVGELSVRTSAGTRTVTVTGYGSAPGLLLSAPPLAFGTIDARAGGKGLSVTVSNSWTRPETVTAIRLPGEPYRLTGLPRLGAVLAPRRAVTISVRFDPARAGSYRSSLTITVEDRPTTIPLSGNAVTGFARLLVSSRAIDVGDARVGRSRTVTLAVRNGGTVPLTISRAIAPSGEFAAEIPLSEGITLDAGAFVRLRIEFEPTSRGPASARYEFNSNAGGGPVIVTFTGVGI